MVLCRSTTLTRDSDRSGHCLAMLWIWQYGLVQSSLDDQFAPGLAVWYLVYLKCCYNSHYFLAVSIDILRGFYIARARFAMFFIWS